MLMGMISFMTGDPATIDFARLFGATGWVMLVNSGFMAATAAALLKDKQSRMILHALAGAATVGLYTSFGVTSGFLRALTGRKVDWYMIRKAGNEPAVKPSAVS
jgi:ABC-type Zn uptake system ZnuABC Zn-binding protein ZnuA